jgi:ergothioneine biosynthesis protein EgtB
MPPTAAPEAAVDLTRAEARSRFTEVRTTTERLAAVLAPEDQVVQSMPDVSPTKWHRAHVTWFFETFLLGELVAGHRVVHPGYGYLFNSYYEQVGSRHPRNERGLISRPTVAEVAEYRRRVDEAMLELVEGLGEPAWSTVAAPRVALGVHHEQQHQELLLMDIKHVLSRNPLRPAYAPPGPLDEGAVARSAGWVELEGGLVEVGAAGAGFAFDNEGPRHLVHLQPYRLADRLVTNGEWLAFMADGGYERPELWLSDGWFTVQRERWTAPLYWRAEGDRWSQFTLAGERPVAPAEPVCHVSHYEADAFARWAGCRLPLEAEWEHAVAGHPAEGNLLDASVAGEVGPHPRPALDAGGRLGQAFGDVWEWTASPYVAYPRFRPAEGAIGEYNGKFMSNQMVLRGGCCVTPADHVRATYRNFFPPAARWHFGGLRLAADA